MQCVAWIEPWQNQLYCETTPFYTGIGEKKRRTFFLMYTQIAFVTSAEHKSKSKHYQALQVATLGDAELST